MLKHINCHDDWQPSLRSRGKNIMSKIFKFRDEDLERLLQVILGLHLSEI